MTDFYRFGQFVLDPARRTLSCADSAVSLTPKAFDVLLFLVQNPNRLVTKEELLRAVWGDTVVEEGNLTQYISHLRKALGDDSEDTRLIVTIARKGYQFTARVTVAEAADAAKHAPLQAAATETSKTDAQPVEFPARRSNLRHLVSAGANGSRRPRCWPLLLRPSGCTRVTTAE
jgi:DNA-binding winged helix-turn-helix (wHTH) protein